MSWNYKVTEPYCYNSDDKEVYLNSMGLNGWELVSERYIQDGRYEFTFKRQEPDYCAGYEDTGF